MEDTSILTELSADCQSVWTGISVNAPASDGALISAMELPTNIQRKQDPVPGIRQQYLQYTSQM